MPYINVILVCLGALLVSSALTMIVLRQALNRSMLDVPNERSSHTVPTPRGGGIGIVVAVSVGLLVLAGGGSFGTGPLIALLIGGLSVALVGLVDDRYGLPAGIRLAVHLGAALVAVEYVGVPPLRLGEHVIELSWIGYLLSVAAVVWSLNLFNFMDGIDGIAATEATFVSCGAACAAWLSNAAATSIAAPLVVAAACCGFLVWNWPPAKIFMGDVGSGYVGYALAVMALDAAQNDPAAIWWWLICGGVFLVDATVTLVRRGLRRERVLEAHRTHGYQTLARRWGNHARVTLGVLTVNLIWLAPWALAAAKYPDLAACFTIVALLPLVLVALWVGAGRPSGR